MVRTKADSSSVKAAGAKAPRKVTSVPSSSNAASNSEKGKQNSGGGNPYFPRETPSWQKGITNFFKTKVEIGETSNGPATDESSNGFASTETCKGSASEGTSNRSLSDQNETSKMTEDKDSSVEGTSTL